MRDARRRDAREGVIERKAGAIECLAHQVGRFRIEYACSNWGKMAVIVALPLPWDHKRD